MQVKSAFLQMAHQQKKSHVKGKIRQQELWSEESENYIDQGREQAAVLKISQKKQIVKTMSQANTAQKRLLATHEVIARRNIDLAYTSRKRLVFESWRAAVRNEQAFILAVAKVISRSLTFKGFREIHTAAKDNHRDARAEKRLTQIARKRHRRGINEKLNRWKREALMTVNRRTQAAYSNNEIQTAYMREQVEKIKNQNCENTFHYFRFRRLQRLFDGWIRSVEYMQTRRFQNGEIVGMLKLVRQRKHLQRWHLRVAKTK